ncbi:MAG: RHS repeat-associated core domain-containing protein [Anaerolineales bacterium]|nr:RHS repeat-associated core domain-containing protein [Anaerolineales bacterium]
MGDRLTQTVIAQTTNYTLDLNTGLTQVLNDGTNTYLYGNGRIAQTGSATEYFPSAGSGRRLGDALGSVRQLTDASGDITLAKSYAPYGEATMSAGNGTSPFAYTGEQVDVSGLTYLRARYYSSGTGRFISSDPAKATNNLYEYSYSNPINYAAPYCDPSRIDRRDFGGRGWGGVDR